MAIITLNDKCPACRGPLELEHLGRHRDIRCGWCSACSHVVELNAPTRPVTDRPPERDFTPAAERRTVGAAPS